MQQDMYIHQGKISFFLGEIGALFCGGLRGTLPIALKFGIVVNIELGRNSACCTLVTAKETTKRLFAAAQRSERKCTSPVPLAATWSDHGHWQNSADAERAQFMGN